MLVPTIKCLSQGHSGSYISIFLPGVFFGDLDGVESLACVGPALSRTSCGMFSFNASSSAVLFLLGFENRLTGVE